MVLQRWRRVSGSRRVAPMSSCPRCSSSNLTRDGTTSVVALFTPAVRVVATPRPSRPGVWLSVSSSHHPAGGPALPATRCRGRTCRRILADRGMNVRGTNVSAPAILCLLGSHANPCRRARIV